MALGDLHTFTGEEYVDTELAPLLNENFNSLKEYVDDASRWQVMPVQFKGTNATFLIHETSLGTGTTYYLPLVVLDNTDIAKFSACALKIVMSTKNGSKAAVNCDINLQKVHNSNECNVSFNTTNSDDAKAEPCTFTYNNVKYAGLKLTTGNADTLWVSGYTTEEWIDPATTVTNAVVLGSDMNIIPTLFKGLQTDKAPVDDYDVVNKKSLNDLTNIKTYSQLSQIGLSGGVLDNSPYAIGNALPANSMLVVGISGSGNGYPVTSGNLTVVRSGTNHVYYEITSESENGYVEKYILQFSIDTASENTSFVWKRVLTDVDTGYWQPNETVTKDTVRKLVGKQYAGCFLVCKVAGTTGSTQPAPDPADGAGIGGGIGNPVSDVTENNGAVTVVKSDGTQNTFDIVKSVNGVTPTAGNVTIDIPEPVIASEAEAKAGTDNTKYMTPLRVKQAIDEFAKSGWTFNNGATGWTRDNTTGFTIMWGTMKSGNWFSSAIQQTFPKAFSNTNYSVVCIPTGNNSEESVYASPSLESKTTTYFVVRNNKGGTTSGGQYIAVGYTAS